MNTISIALVDDEALIVSLLSDFFQKEPEVSICFTADSGEGCMAALSEPNISPDIILLDLKLKNKSGIEVLTFLKSEHPHIRTIVMSSYYKKSFMGFMLKTGAAAFIPKGISSFHLLEIIKEVHRKGVFLMPDQLEVIRDQVSSRSPRPILDRKSLLSKREIEVLRLLCYQKTAKEIGEQLFITQRTVEGHKNNLFLKTATKNLAGLVIYAIQNNLVKTEEILL